MDFKQANLHGLGITLSCLVAGGFWFIGTLSAQTEDFAGEDHPLVSRYQGSVIDGYDAREHDRFVLALGKPIRCPDGGWCAEKTQELEGKVTRILYRNPEGRSAFEVFRNYELALQGAGFTTLYKCLPAECQLTYVFLVYPTARTLERTRPRGATFAPRGNLHYLAAKATTATGTAYVSLLFSRHQNQSFVSTLLEVIETTEMDTGMVSVDAAAILQGIDATGHMPIYGIHFDTGSATIKPESAATLAEIAKLLNQNPALKLLVVGHTDNQGGYDMNMDLSGRRADSVVKALVAQGIAAGRLRPVGVGYVSPVATNETEAGRAKNRRVELVKQ